MIMSEFVVVKGQPNSNKKECRDCKFLFSLVTLWCANKKAIEYRTIRLANAINCEFWQPMRDWNELKLWEKLFSFIKIKKFAKVDLTCNEKGNTMECKNCKSNDVDVSAKDLSDFTYDNIIKIYTCKNCGHVETETIHIG